MNKKIFFNLVFFIAVLLVSFQNISAHFVCGILENSEDNMSSDWFDVRLYYPENRNVYTTCGVSPEDQKYCCDAFAIPPLGSWIIGKTVSAEVYSPESEYAAGPVSIITTGEGYDVLPKMKLEKIINIYSPLDKVILSNQNTILLNLTSKYPYNFIELEKNNNKSILCLNCSVFQELIGAEFGMNKWKVISSFFNLNRSIISYLDFAILNSAESSRNLKKVKSEETVEMKVEVFLSHSVENLELKEYVPINWEIINVTDGLIREYSDSHRVIIWNVSGKNIVKSYYIKSPNIFIFPKKYVFKLELENINLSLERVIVHKFFSFSQDFRSNSLRASLRSDISPSRPLVIKNEQGLETLAIFPSKKIKNVEFNLIEDGFEDDLDNVIFGYKLDTNIRFQDIDKIFIEFKIDKTVFNQYKNIDLFVYGDSWEKINLISYLGSTNYSHYKTFLDPTNKIALVGDKK